MPIRNVVHARLLASDNLPVFTPPLDAAIRVFVQIGKILEELAVSAGHALGVGDGSKLCSELANVVGVKLVLMRL